MRQKINWFIAGVLLAINISLQAYALRHLDLDDLPIGSEFVFRWITYVTLELMLAAILVTLLAFIPFRRMEYGQKMKSLFPPGLAAVAVLFIFFDLSAFYMEQKQGLIHRGEVRFESVDVPPGLDCSSIKNGTFEVGNLLIERHGDTQKETYKDTKVSAVFKLEWVSNCEYVLSSSKPGDGKLKVKVVSVSANDYKCYVAQDSMANKYKVRIVKGGV